MELRPLPTTTTLVFNKRYSNEIVDEGVTPFQTIHLSPRHLPQSLTSPPPSQDPSRGKFQFDSSPASTIQAADMARFKIPQLVREFLAEALGTFLLVFFGNGSIAQKTGMGDNFLSIAFGYGFG